jgi:nucleolin
MKVKAENLWPLIMDFVETYFGEDDLNQFIKYFSLDKVVKAGGGDHRADPIVKHGGLQAMLACFLKNNKEALKDFKAHLKGTTETKKKAPPKKQESSESESSSECEASESSESEEEKKPVKKVVGQKRKAKESSSSSSEESESDSDDDKKKKAKKTVANGGPASKRQRADSISSRTRGHSDVKEAETFKAPMKPSANHNFMFQRINEDKFNQVLQ